MSIELIVLTMFGSLIVLLMAGIPIGFAMASIAIVMTALLWDFQALHTVIVNIFGVMWNESFIAIPLFLFMGIVLERAGIAEGLFELLYRWSGHVRGGLAMGVVVICAIFAAMTGVAGAACIAMGVIALPAMLKHKYDKSLAIGCIAAPSTLGILIPPSIVMIFIAIIGHISVRGLFMAGILPGLSIAILFILYIALRGFLQPQLCPATPEKFTLRQKVMSLTAVTLPILIILAVLGSIFTGAATPVEASAIGVAAVFIATFVNRTFSLKLVSEAAIATFRIVSMAMWIGFGAVTFSCTFAALGGIEFIKGLLLGLEINHWLILGVIIFIAFVLGMFIEPFGITFLVAPLGFPIVTALGFDPTWFGIIFVITLMTGYITPPFGFNLFYLKAVVPPDISMGDIWRSTLPFLGIMILGMAVLMTFPQLALWLPALMAK